MAKLAVSLALALESHLYSIKLEVGFEIRGSNKLVKADCLFSNTLVLDPLIWNPPNCDRIPEEFPAIKQPLPDVLL